MYTRLLIQRAQFGTSRLLMLPRMHATPYVQGFMLLLPEKMRHNIRTMGLLCPLHESKANISRALEASACTKKVNSRDWRYISWFLNKFIARRFDVARAIEVHGGKHDRNGDSHSIFKVEVYTSQMEKFARSDIFAAHYRSGK